MVKYDNLGNVLWARAFTGPGDYDQIFSIAIDNANNIYIAGHGTNNLYIGSHLLHGYEILAKLDSSGNVLWAKDITNMTSYTNWESICHLNNNIYYLSEFGNNFSSVILGNDTLVTNGLSDIYLMKCDTSGNILKAIKIGGTDSDFPDQVTTDNNSHLYITGSTLSTSINFGNLNLNMNYLPSHHNGGFIAKLDSSMNTIWSIKISDNCTPYSVITDKSDNVYVTGSYTYDTIAVNGFMLFNSYPGTKDIFLAKYDSSGNFLWAKRAGGNRDDVVNMNYSLARDSYNNIYLSGNFTSSTITFGNNSLINNYGIYNYPDIFICKYDSLGNDIWATSIGGDYKEYEGCITVDNMDNLFIVGENIRDTFAIGTDTMKTTGIFLAKMDLSEYSQIKQIKEQNSIIIYPNPSNGNFEIEIPQDAKYILISNSLGQVIEKRTIKNQSKLHFTLRINGIYFIQVISDKQIITKKVVISNE